MARKLSKPKVTQSERLSFKVYSDDTIILSYGGKKFYGRRVEQETETYAEWDTLDDHFLIDAVDCMLDHEKGPEWHHEERGKDCRCIR